MSISVRLDPETESALRQMLRSHDIPLSAFVREAIREKLARAEQDASPYAIGVTLFGRYSSGETGRSTRRKQIFRERVRERYRG